MPREGMVGVVVLKKKDGDADKEKGTCRANWTMLASEAELAGRG